MKYIQTLDEFNSFDYSNTIELNEGLLSSIFGNLGALLKSGWSNIKGDPTVKQKLESIDKSLSGYTQMKIQQAARVHNIRQFMTDYWSRFYKSKIDELDRIKDSKQSDIKELLSKDLTAESTDDEKKARKDAKTKSDLYSFKDKAVKDSLDKIEKAMNEEASTDDLKNWKRYMMDRMSVDMNDIIIALSDKELGEDAASKNAELKKKAEAAKKEEDERIKKANAEESKRNEAEMKKIADERNKALNSVKVTPSQETKGAKVYQDMFNSFKKLAQEVGLNQEDVNNIISESLIIEADEAPAAQQDNAQQGNEQQGEQQQGDQQNGDQQNGDQNAQIDIEKIKKALQSDKSFGLEVIANEDAEVIQKVIKECGAIFSIINSMDSGKVSIALRKCAGTAVQAMIVATCQSVAYGITGNESILSGDALATLMARCAMKDKVIGYGLPVVDASQKLKEGDDVDDKDSTVFAAVIGALEKTDDKKEIIGKDNLNEFRSNMKKLDNDVRNTAKKLTDEYAKEHDVKKADAEAQKEQ